MALRSSIQIKDVPDQTHAVLRRRAAAARQSLQEYLRSRLIEEASAPPWTRSWIELVDGRAARSRSRRRRRRCARIVLVIDASALVPALADDGPDGDGARSRLRGESLVAPELIDLEAASVIRRRVRIGHLDVRRAELALSDLIDLPLRRAPHRSLLARCWEIRENVTVYDAAYVALAERLDVALVTADARLAGAPGLGCQVELLSAAGGGSAEPPA